MTVNSNLADHLLKCNHNKKSFQENISIIDLEVKGVEWTIQKKPSHTHTPVPRAYENRSPMSPKIQGANSHHTTPNILDHSKLTLYRSPEKSTCISLRQNKLKKKNRKPFILLS